VKNMVVRQGMVLALLGVAIGVAAAFGLARYVATLLFGVTARDPIVFAAVPALLAAVAFAAVWLPARRASRVDPIVALRCE
jgi:putative ABC transport system permease protein